MNIKTAVIPGSKFTESDSWLDTMDNEMGKMYKANGVRPTALELVDFDIETFKERHKGWVTYCSVKHCTLVDAPESFLSQYLDTKVTFTTSPKSETLVGYQSGSRGLLPNSAGKWVVTTTYKAPDGTYALCDSFPMKPTRKQFAEARQFQLRQIINHLANPLPVTEVEVSGY